MTLSLARVLAIVVALVSTFALPGTLSAQEDKAPFVIEFGIQDAVLARMGVVRALMGLTECGSVDLSAGGRTLVVGGPGAPAQCNQPWRVVNLVADNGSPFSSNDPVFQPGGSHTITTITPFPAVDGPGVPPFWIEVRADGDRVRESDLARLGSLTAYVGGVACGSASAANQTTALTVPVGEAGTSDICRQKGAEISLIDGVGNRLRVRPSVGPGRFYTLTNLTTAPAGASAPAPAAAGYGIATAGAGSGPSAVVLLMTLLGLVVARRSTAPR